MKTLHQVIETNAGGQSRALLKHLNAHYIMDWPDLTKANLANFRDALLNEVAPSSAKTYMAVLRAIMSRYEEEVNIPCRNYAEVLRVKGDRPVKTYLSMAELERLEHVHIKNESEQKVLDEFLIGAYTGMRISDTREVSEENVNEGHLSYVSIKTGVHASIPLKPGVLERISRSRCTPELPLCTFNRIIRRLCRRAGITSKVKVRHAGKDTTLQKWECISSHTARISFVSNLAALGVPIIEISKMAGHTSTGMTERYIANGSIKVSARAMAFFK